jgi:glycosyltransferase involved in cell wall biosynthesis
VKTFAAITDIMIDRPIAPVPRKLLIYTHAMAGGGAERVCALLASGFLARGSDVVLVTDHRSAENDAYLDPRLRQVVLGSGHLGAVWRLARLLREEKPDVSFSAIGVSNLKHSLAALLAGRARRAVLSIHAFAVSEPQLLSRIAYWATPLLSRLTARTVAVSHSLRTHLIERWHAVPTRTVAIPNPVLVRADAETVAAPPSVPIVLACGRLIPGKNMRGLVRAFAAVAAGRSAKLVILGEGPERAALEADIDALGLDGRVHLPGYIAEPWAFYSQAACFVSASLAESFSMVIVEALAYGLPVVAVDCAGPREVLADGRYGTLVAPGDEPALAAAIARALDAPGDPAPRQRRAAAFSVDAALETYSRLFADLLEDAEAGVIKRVLPISTTSP